jgi:putative transposase
MLKETLSMSERLACKAVGLARSTYRRLPLSQTPTDPDAEMRAWLRGYATKHPCHGFRRAWAALRYDERREINKKKMSRLWREEGLQVRVHSPRKRAGISSVPPVEADAPDVVWAIDFQFDSTIDGKAIKIASMIDEHTRLSLLHVVERSITGERLVFELEKAFAAAGGPPKVLRMDNGPEMVSQALQRFCENKTGIVYIPPGCPWDNATSNRSTTDSGGSASTATTGTPCWTPAWSSATSNTSTTTDTATQRWATAHRPSTLRRAGTPTPRWPARSTESGTKQPDSESGWT